MTYLELPDHTTVHVTVEHTGGDLLVRGWDRAALSAEGDEPTLTERPEGGLLIHASGDLELRLPTGAQLTIGHVGGDAKVTDVQGALQIGHIGADLTLRKIGPVHIDRIGSDLRIKRASGDVTVSRVGSDATVRDVEGALTLGQIGSDLYLRNLMGPCEVESVGADLVLSTGFVPGAVYRFNVGQDIVCRVPPDADVRFRVLRAADVAVDTADAELVDAGDYEEVVFGDGAALVELAAGQDIRFVGQEEDYLMAINIQLEEELEARVSGLEEKLMAQLSGLDDLIANNAERVRQRAERQAERAMRAAERSMRKAEKQVERGKRKRGFVLSFGADGIPRPPSPPPPPVDPVTDQERLLILRMVENKQITVDEAERLLAALEGRTPD
ncbi:MAG: hypothetical protein Kow0077_13250 [Anaerolineae bacterium]